MFAYVKSGRLWKIEGTRRPTETWARSAPGVMDTSMTCTARTESKAPERVGDKFEPITWEQAYKEISTRIN
jgi:anaerobic selenocysteine-containing dehydrogenase